MAASSPEAYDVFLNFRGEDTRKNFISHLHHALREKDIRVFLDDEGIKRGDELSTTLLRTIERSRISIITFSEDYASSTWCLDELTKIIECKKTKGQILLPIFYNVPPSHVRNQRGKYQTAFIGDEKYNPSKVQQWKEALREAADIKGWDSTKTGSDFELVKAVVEDVLQKMNDIMDPVVPRRLVGIDKIAKVESSHGRSDYVCKVGEKASSSDIIPIGLIDTTSVTITIKARVIRLWNVYGYHNSDLEMVLLDEENTKIQASVPKPLVKKYLDLMKEGNVYLISNFGVGTPKSSYRPSRHRFVIRFTYETVVHESSSNVISLYGFSFVPYRDLIEASQNDTYLIDYIGQIVSYGSMENKGKDGNKNKKIDIVIEDSDKNRIPCSLWQSYADQMNDLIARRPNGPTIIVLQFVRAKMLNVPVLSTSWYSTRVMFNPDIPEVHDLKKRMPESNESGSQMMCQSSSQSHNSLDEDLLYRTPRKTISEVCIAEDEGYCVILAKVIDVEMHEEWFYNACKKCGKKVGQLDGNYYCELCMINVFPAVQRYRLQLRVADELDNISVVLFHKEVKQFLRKDVTDLRASHLEKRALDSYPEEFNSFVGKKFLFKLKINAVNLKNPSSTYTVARYTWDSGLIENFITLGSSSQEVNTEPTDPFPKDDTDVAIVANNDVNSTVGENEQNGHDRDVNSPIKATSKSAIGEDVSGQSSTSKSKKARTM